jgi:hypothetical protein
VQRLSHTIRIVALLVLIGSVARADHHGMAMGSGDDDSPNLMASVSLLAATFSPSQSANMDYGGNYEGVIAGASWSNARYAAGASWAYYRLLRNGVEQFGIGDLVVHGQATLLARGEITGGAALAVSAPTGDDVLGLGMGHPMVMPAGFAAWHHGRVALAGSFGYSRALASGTHVHGMSPLVEPMNMSELTWSASGDYSIAAGVRAGVRMSGGVPVGSMAGTDRVIGALRVAWGAGSIDTAAELQAGLAGDPFTIRGVVSTALRF